jgi:hypothetical protein
MEDYNSKYTGEQVEEFLDQIANGEIGGGGITSETDPIFSASPAASITEEKKAEWDDKVDKVSGKQLSTEDFTSALKTKLEGLSNYDDTELSEALSTLRGDFDKLVSGDTTTAIKTFNEVIAFLDGVQDTQDLSSIIASIEQQIAGKMDKVTLATVATSGSYNDLSNKPTIPSAVTESTVSGWGFTKNTGTYSKPSGGIPKTDLATAVQTSLGKADTALQSYTEQYKGTVTGVKVNGSTKSPSSGTVDIGNVVTSVKINGSSKSPSSGVVDLGTVITSHQDISGKQDKLVSGTNIKTINGQSLLGSGNITIEGGSGGGGSSSGSSAYSEVNHGASDTTFTLTPNTFHVWDEVSALTLALGSEISGVANEYLFQFTSGSAATSLTLSEDIKWANDNPPTIVENMIYQVSILKGLASVLEFANAPSLINNKATVSISGTKYLVSLQYAAASNIVVKVRTADGLISVSILSGEISKTANSIGPMVDSGAFIESITPSVDTAYNYVW